MTESAEVKAQHRLGERRFDILKADRTGIWALVRGDGGTYKTKWTRSRGGLLVGECNCDCPRQTCWHLKGLRMIWTGEKR